ncbi:putative cytochrome p450 protein [Neofusicoccum parvum UCRNP2]|uniref:Putative cytochrome p450 protein n=1 Tax=Botryosphaeria parva (strain UCR-NP2) TaxID=1287680 RepID=R1GMZ3_BOTPV|nr:putative cytochrome p450 protein [Neofusicoccum parvum UCRNP2]
MPAVEDEIHHAFGALLPDCEDWTPILVADTFTAIISRASNRMLGGKALSRNDEWTATSINFTADTWLASQRLKRYPAFLQPLAQYWIPEMAQVRRHGAVARRVIAPLVEERLAAGKAPLDLLQMLWDGARGKDKTPEFMAYTALAISFAAIRTSSSVPTHLVYDLCARPEYIEPLRAEIEQMLAEEGGRFTKAGLNRLVKLDSFMKESQRFNPLSFLTFGRLVHNDLALHDGVTIPAGTMVGIPAYAISQDPQLYPSPATFDGFRFVDRGSAQFVTTNAANLSWGYGKHACSGRFFAAGEIKMIVAHFLRHYDFRLAGADAKGRPANIAFELQNMADPTVQVESALLAPTPPSPSLTTDDMAPSKTVLITGCSEGGIGFALAKEFQARGLHVFATARSPAKMAALEHLPNVTLLPLDVCSPASIAAAVAAVSAKTGGTLDFLVNNSGSQYVMPVLDVDLAQAKAMYEVNVWGVVAVTQAFAPLVIAARGSIANMASIAGLIEALRLELQPFGVRVVTVITGSVESNIFVNAPEHHLPAGSRYARAEKEVAARATGSDVDQHSKREDFARALVADIVGGASGKVYRGKMSTLVKLVTAYMPTFVIDRLSAHGTGLEKVGH